MFNEIVGRNIPYTRCLPHGTNLVIEHATAASTLVTKVYEVIQEIYNFFTKSTKRLAKLKDKQTKIENRLNLRNLSKTRWSVRAETVEAV